MRYSKHAALTAVAGLAGLLAFAAPAAAADGAGSDPGHHKKEIIKLLAVETQSTFVDEDGDGEGDQGDEFVSTGNLFRDGDNVGTYSQVCTITRTTDNDEFDLQCAGTLSLEEGQLTLQGRFTVTDSEPVEPKFAITGGTKEFRTAAGSVRATNVSETEAKLKVNLIR